MQGQFPNVQVSLCRWYFFASHLDYYEDTILLQKKGKRETILIAMNSCNKVCHEGCTNPTGSVVQSSMQCAAHNKCAARGMKEKQVTAILDKPKTITGTNFKPKQCLKS